MRFNDIRIMFYAIFILLITVAILGIITDQKNRANASDIYVNDYAFNKVRFEGHDYLFRGKNPYFIHSESCPCKKGNLK